MGNAEQNKVGIIIVTHNADEFVKLCLDSIERYTTIPREVIVVDNNSRPALREYLKTCKNIRTIFNSANTLWAEGCNIGIKAVSADVTHILLLNSDTEIRRADWLQRMINVANSDSRIGIVATTVNVVRLWPLLGAPDGHCMMIKRQLIEEIGVLDSKKFPWYGGPFDFTARAFKKGYIYKIMPEHPELVAHYHGMSRREKTIAEEIKKFKTTLNITDIIKSAGLPAWPMPRFIWEIYKRLPGRPFFELTGREEKSAKGSCKNGREKYR